MPSLRRPPLVSLLVVGLALTPLVTRASASASADQAGLPPLASQVEAGWRRYVAAVEARRTRELTTAPRRFLVLDSEGHADERRVLRSGGVVVAAMSPPSATVPPDLDGARIHHWRGAVFIPATTVASLVASLETTPPRQDDILRARILKRGPDGIRVYLRLRRRQVVTVVYDTEHLVQFAAAGPGRAQSTSRAVRIAEIASAGTSIEHTLSADDDHDFLWRLSAYWRYEDVPGGVIAECESLSLSRDVPFGLGLAAEPLIRRAAESSMRAALLALRGESTG